MEKRKNDFGADIRKYNFGADIWSLGCIMAFYCNRGQPLFSSPLKVLRWTGLRLGAIRGYSSELVDVIGRMLRPDPRARPSAMEWWGRTEEPKLKQGRLNKLFNGLSIGSKNKGLKAFK